MADRNGWRERERERERERVKRIWAVSSPWWWGGSFPPGLVMGSFYGGTEWEIWCWNLQSYVSRLFYIRVIIKKRRTQMNLLRRLFTLDSEKKKKELLRQYLALIFLCYSLHSKLYYSRDQLYQLLFIYVVNWLAYSKSMTLGKKDVYKCKTKKKERKEKKERKWTVETKEWFDKIRR